MKKNIIFIKTTNVLKMYPSDLIIILNYICYLTRNRNIFQLVQLRIKTHSREQWKYQNTDQKHKIGETKIKDERTIEASRKTVRG